MNKKILVIDEKKYPIVWRFNSEDCLLSSDEKRRVVFLDEVKSKNFWGMTFPFDHLMKMESSFFSVIEKTKLDFNHPKESSLFFEGKLTDFPFVFFFWGKQSGAIVPVDIFIKSWGDFFYPSDETSVITIANENKMIFSHEEAFIFADILK